MSEKGRYAKMRARGCLCVLFLLGVAIVWGVVEAGLQTDGMQCGERKCKPQEYCSSHDRQCQPCTDICSKNSHNYQEDVCNGQCQDYLHEQRFVTRKEQPERDDIRSEVARLTVLVIVTLVILVLVFVMLLAAMVLFIWYRRRCSQPPNYFKSKPTDNGKVSYKTEALKLDMPATPPQSTTTAPPPVTPATTSTPLSSRPRYPKEDPTLEYAAYDNPALTPSPVFDNKQETTPVTRRQESSF